MLSPRAYGYFICFAAAFGSLLFGYQISFMAMFLGLDIVRDLFFLKAKHNSREALIASLFTLGSIAGSFIISTVGDKVGRKVPILLACLTVAIGTALQLVQNADTAGIAVLPNDKEGDFVVVNYTNAVSNNPIFIYAGRVLSGLGIGIIASVVPMFISEIAPPDVRGILTTINQFMITFGILFASIVNSIFFFTMDIKNPDTYIWRWIVGFPLVPALALFGMMTFVPESPKALIALGKREAALKCLCAHRCTTREKVLPEFGELEKDHEKSLTEGQGSWSEIFETSISKRILIASALQVFQQLSGINVIITWANTLFNTKEDYMNHVVLPITLFTVNFFGTIPGMFLVDKLGRSRLLTLGGIGIVLCFLCNSIIYSTQASFNIAKGVPEIKDTFYNVLSIICTFVYILFFASTWGPIVWTYQSEIFPMRVKSKCVGICTSANFLSGFALSFLWPTMRDTFRQHSYIFFLVTTSLMTIFAFFCVPETKGLTENEIDCMFKGIPVENNDKKDTHNAVSSGSTAADANVAPKV